MNWYYENNGKPIGPITDTVMREWVKQKSLAPAQLVRKEGESEWQILAQTDLCITQENEAGFRLSAAPKHQTESTNMNLTEELSKLADLRSSGALSEAEFIQVSFCG